MFLAWIHLNRTDQNTGPATDIKACECLRWRVGIHFYQLLYKLRQYCRVCINKCIILATNSCKFRWSGFGAFKGLISEQTFSFLFSVLVFYNLKYLVLIIIITHIQWVWCLKRQTSKIIIWWAGPRAWFFL